MVNLDLEYLRLGSIFSTLYSHCLYVFGLWRGVALKQSMPRPLRTRTSGRFTILEGPKMFFSEVAVVVGHLRRKFFLRSWPKVEGANMPPPPGPPDPPVLLGTLFVQWVRLNRTI